MLIIYDQNFMYSISTALCSSCVTLNQQEFIVLKQLQLLSPANVCIQKEHEGLLNCQIINALYLILLCSYEIYH